MALVTANGVGVIGGSITMPLVGVWTADLVIDQPDGTGFDAGTKVTIASQDGFSLAGVVVPNRTGEFLDAVHVRVVGGAGGMGKTATGRSFMQPNAFVRDVMNGLASDSGETLSSTMDAGFLATNLSAWSVVGDGTVSQALGVLLFFVAPAFDWRFLADGSLWIGSETWPAGTSVFEVLSYDPTEGTYQLGADSPWIMPGMSLDGVGNVNMVEHNITSDKVRSRVWLNFDYDRGFKQAVTKIIDQQVAYVDYYATYVCQVVAQSTDLTTADVQRVGARNQQLIGGMQRVPARFLTGIKTQVAPGATALLGWDGGNPQAPFVLMLSSDGALKVALSDSLNDSLEISSGTVTIKIGGVVVFQASATAVGLGLVRTLPFLYLGATDAIFGAPVLQNPAAVASIVKGG